LGKCISMPTKRAVHDAHDALRYYNNMCNGVVKYLERHWDDKGVPDTILNGETPLPKQRAEYPSTELYNIGRKCAPLLASGIVAYATSQEITGKKQLNKRMPRDHFRRGKKGFYFWQAMLLNEVQRPTYDGNSIPLIEQGTSLHYDEEHNHIAMTLLSREAGRTKCQMKWRFEARQMTTGQKAILRRISTGDWRILTSTLVYHDPKKRSRFNPNQKIKHFNGKKKKAKNKIRPHHGWFVHVVYDRPRKNLGLSRDRVAVLTLQDDKDAQNPFKIQCEGCPPWFSGQGQFLKAQYKKINDKRLFLRKTYRIAGSGQRGHGRERIESVIRPGTRQLQRLSNKLLEQVVAHVFDYCVRNNCGVVEWREPKGEFQRGRSWYHANRLQMDFTGFRSKLVHKLHDLHDIVVRIPTPPKAKPKKDEGDDTTAVAT